VKVKKTVPAQKNALTELKDHCAPETSIAPVDAKTDKKYLRMVLWAGLSAIFLAFGALACGLLSREENVGKAIVLFLGGLAGAAGCIFFFYFLLREISPKPRAPFISTLH
jgi:hypothetical protein